MNCKARWCLLARGHRWWPDGWDGARACVLELSEDNEPGCGKRCQVFCCLLLRTVVTLGTAVRLVWLCSCQKASRVIKGKNLIVCFLQVKEDTYTYLFICISLYTYIHTHMYMVHFVFYFE